MRAMALDGSSLMLSDHRMAGAERERKEAAL
jgi:hypothetical protein